MDQFYPQNLIDDSRREFILRRLEEERELRRKHIREGRCYALVFKIIVSIFTNYTIMYLSMINYRYNRTISTK